MPNDVTLIYWHLQRPSSREMEPNGESDVSDALKADSPACTQKKSGDPKAAA
jgi:hypothetical protein